MENTFESILEEVSKMQFSDDSILDLISYVNKAIQISEAIDPDRSTNTCLNNLVQTKEKELDSLQEKDIPYSEREERFKEVLRNFKSDLHMWCIE